MKSLFRNISHTFAAGCAGALANSLTVWLFGAAGVMAAAEVKMVPAFTLGWLYPRIVWGGLWGLLFLLPVKRTVTTGLWLSLVPSLAALLYFLPRNPNIGLLGLGLGTLTPLFVIFFNAIWGLVTVLWLSFAGEGRE